MKRSLIIIFILLFCFNNSFALENIDNNVCVKPEGILEENNNKEVIKEYINLILIDGPIISQRIDWELEKEEVLKYYMDCFITDDKEYKIYQDILLLYYFGAMLKTHSDCGIFLLSDFSSSIKIGEKSIRDLKKYGKNNENYEYYLGRYSFLLGIAYYNEKQYKKALNRAFIEFECYILFVGKYKKNIT